MNQPQNKDIELPLLDKSQQRASSTNQDRKQNLSEPSQKFIDYVAKISDTPGRYQKDFSKLRFITFTDVFPTVKALNRSAEQAFDTKDLPTPYSFYNIEEKVAKLDHEWQYELRKPKPELLKALYRTFKKEFYTAGAMMFVVFNGRIFSTLMLGKTIDYISQASEGHDYDHSEILNLAHIFAAVYLFINVFNSHYWCYIYLFGGRLRLTIVGLIYKKIQGITLNSLQQINLGRVINLLANDVNDIDTGFLQVWPVIWAPINLLIAGIFIYDYFGIYVMISLAGLYGSIFASQHISKITKIPTQEKNAISDERTKATNEIIECIRLIKLYCWEKPLKQAIEKLRIREFEAYIRLFKIEILGRAISEQAVYICAFLMFTAYTVYGQGLLNPEKVYASIMMLGFVKMWCILFPHYGRIFIVKFKVMRQRLENILLIPDIINQDEALKRGLEVQNSSNKDTEMNELTQSKRGSRGGLASSHHSSKQNSIRLYFSDYTAFWSQESQVPCLKNINLTIKPGEVTAIIGKVASGKTSFLYAIMREIPTYNGDFGLNGSIAYVEQEPIIFSGTVRSNILFGCEYEQEFYDQIIKACNLGPDLRQLSDGDLTRIGERGVNLSGGQKARISMARALYSRSDIYLLDDPLSAVDSKVARHLFDKAICGDLLKDKIIILVTHHIQFAKEANRILVFEDGKIKADGTYDELKEQSIGLLDTFSKEMGDEDDVAKLKAKSSKKTTLQQDTDEYAEEDDKKKVKEDVTVVTFQTYVNYIKESGNVWFFFFTVFLHIFQYCVFVGWNRFVGYWAYQQQSYYQENDEDLTGFDNTYYIVFGFVLTATLFFARYYKTVISQRYFCETNTKIHHQMIHKIVRSAALFFDKTPVGTILNRFSNDLGQLDKANASALHDVFQGIVAILVLATTIVWMNPWVIIPCIVIAWGLSRVRRIFAKPTQEAKRLDLSSRSPLYSEISSTIHGLLIIRVFRQGGNFMKNFLELMYENSRCLLFQQRTMRLFGMLLDIWLYCLTVSGIYLYIFVSFNSVIEPGLFGLALSLLLEIANQSSYFIKQTLQVDISMQSAERTLRYTQLPEEAPDVVESEDKKVQEKFPEGWPAKGEITFKNIFMRYDHDLPYALNGLSFHIEPGMKVGCVGRTGAGKSSIIQVLFRMVEIEDRNDSEMLIDGVDIRKIGLNLLRKNLAIIPQTAVIFTGTIRRNLDPFSQFKDEELFEALGEVNLRRYIERLEKQLETDMTVSTTIFSAGQKQLMCLARAILYKSKVLILDEATANVDIETDAFIQRKINERFKDCTVITIAHRLTTIAHYDRVLVLDKGRAVELDSPYKLLVNETGDKSITNSSGVFAQMVNNAGSNMAKKVFDIAYRQYQRKSSKQIRLSQDEDDDD